MLPAVRLLATHAAGQFQAAHGRKRARLVDQLFGGRAVGGDHAAQRSDAADVPHQGARIQIPDRREFVAIQVMIGGLRGAPVGRQGGKLAHDQRLDVRPRRFLVVKIGAHVSDVRISEADDLAGVAGIGEDFLVTGETGIENDFTAAARAGARGAPVKNSSVLECENGRARLYFRQRFLQEHAHEKRGALTATVDRVRLGRARLGEFASGALLSDAFTALMLPN